MINKLLPLFLVITLRTIRCSLVIDSIAQKGLYVSDYCPNMKFCREGAHVMCMYYDANRVMGPRCSNAVNISISADLATQLLDVTNAIRSKIATGKEVGKDGKLLPRGYGIFRLKWDNELATFAQVLANQCILRHDLCRATKRFPDPGQNVGLVRFTVPDWNPISAKGKSPPGLTNVKLAYAITQSLKSWYGQKTSVTEQMVKTYPDWTLTPTNQVGRLYLEMIFGSTTHMGCGMSAYTEYIYYDNQRQSPFNSLQVICNYSSRARKGNQSYTIEPPIPGRGYSPQCGCPPGSREDSDCLCVTDVQEYPQRALDEPARCGNGETTGYCEPTLVLLPIFTMEDAPPQKLYQQAEEMKDPLKNFILQRIDNSSSGVQRTRQSMEFIDFFERNEKKNVFQRPTSIPQPLNTALMQSPSPKQDVLYKAPISMPILPRSPASEPPLPPRPSASRSHPSLSRLSPPRLNHPPPPPPPRALPPPPPLEDRFVELRTRDEEQKPMPRRPLPPRLPPRPVMKKSSIFTRVDHFKLPGRKSMGSPFEVIKKDVAPRKDFSKVHKVVDDYLRGRPGFRRVDDVIQRSEENKPQTIKKLQTEEAVTEVAVTETGLKKSEEKVLSYNQYLKQNNNSIHNDKDIDIKDDSDNKLMTLLDTLEQEVKHIALEGSEKELFDAKIRKIYGSLVGKSAALPKPTNTNEVEGESNNNGKREFDHLNEEEKILELQKSIKRLEVENKIDRVKNYDYFVQKRNDKLIDSFDQKKDNDNIDQYVFNDFDRKNSDIYDRKNNDNFDHKYSDVEHKYTDDLDRKYSENNFDRNYNDVQHKFTDNFDKKHHYDIDRTHDGVPASRNQDKYESDKDMMEFREYKDNNPQNSIEVNNNNVKYRNFDKYAEKDIKNSRSSKRNPYRSKYSERKHRNTVDEKRTKSIHSRNDLNDPLSVERRKYYRKKIDNIERKLRGSHNNRRRHDQRNERPMRRLRPNRDSIPRTRSKSQADNFYMPERARFLHGF